MIHDMNYLLASEHQADLQREADRARLARRATCGQASGLAGLLDRFRGADRSCD